MQYLKVDAIDKKHSSYFMHLVLDAMKYRQENNIHRPDMINLLMEARGMIPSAHVSKSQNHQWTDMEMVAQCFLFYLAGFETTAGLMSLASHELMENPDVQNRLYEEIQQTDEELEGQQLTYEALQKMTYMEMVVSEVLRKWPIPLSTDRMCNKDFEYVSTSTGERVVIKKGDVIRIPICGIHLDPKYYENPNVIDPERFNEENKSKIQYGTYLPFGMGPRSCIGNRFALLEAKAFLYYLLRDYRLEPSPKSCIPLVLDPKSVNLMAKNGFWIKFIPRKS
uniref:Cytochrome P450 n=1 Tax=Stomoxys calcitrans TaxID=35570 RepID=A0A1I8Q640_STOCA